MNGFFWGGVSCDEVIQSEAILPSAKATPNNGSTANWRMA